MSHFSLRVITSILSICLVVSTAFSSATTRLAGHEQRAGTGLVVSISDIHFDPYYDRDLFDRLIKSDHTKWQGIFAGSSVQNYGIYGKNTNYLLFKSALENIYQQAPHPDFIIVSGDFLTHDFQEHYETYTGNKNKKALNEFVRKTIAFVSWMIEKQFPQTPVYPAIGNNDSDCGDYAIEPGGQFLRTTASEWKRLLRNRSNVRSFMRTFPAMGFYSVAAPNNKNHRLIVLNTTFVSNKYNKYENSCKRPITEPGREELKWLESELSRAKAAGSRVWLVYHIPPGIDVFASLKEATRGNAAHVEPFWQPDYNQQFLELVMRYSAVIAGSFAGHIHMDSFELIKGPQGQSASLVHITPAFSPVYNNNPAFEVFAYDRNSSNLKDYTAYYFDLASAAAQKNGPVRWTEEYTFTTAYGQPAFSLQSLEAVYEGISINGRDFRTKFDRYYDVSNTASPGIDPANWHAYWCGIRNLTIPEYTACLKQR